MAEVYHEVEQGKERLFLSSQPPCMKLYRVLPSPVFLTCDQAFFFFSGEGKSEAAATVSPSPEKNNS